MMNTAAMSRKNVDIGRRFAAAFQRDGVKALAEFCDPDVEWHEDPSFPESDVYRGVEAVTAYGEQFFSEFSEIHYEIGEIVADSKDHVVFELKVRGVGRTSGAAFELPACWAMTFREGRILRCYAYLDRNRALEAVGLEEPSST